MALAALSVPDMKAVENGAKMEAYVEAYWETGPPRCYEVVTCHLSTTLWCDPVLLGGDQCVEGERGQPGALAEQDGQGMAEDLAQPAGQQVPGVARPDLLGPVALGGLADDRLDAPLGVGQPLRPGLPLARCPLVGSQ